MQSTYSWENLSQKRTNKSKPLVASKHGNQTQATLIEGDSSHHCTHDVPKSWQCTRPGHYWLLWQQQQPLHNKELAFSKLTCKLKSVVTKKVRPFSFSLTRTPYTLVIRKLLLQSACALLLEQPFCISARANSIHFATFAPLETERGAPSHQTSPGRNKIQ